MSSGCGGLAVELAAAPLPPALPPQPPLPPRLNEKTATPRRARKTTLAASGLEEEGLKRVGRCVACIPVDATACTTTAGLGQAAAEGDGMAAAGDGTAQPDPGAGATEAPPLAEDGSAGEGRCRKAPCCITHLSVSTSINQICLLAGQTWEEALAAASADGNQQYIVPPQRPPKLPPDGLRLATQRTITFPPPSHSRLLAAGLLLCWFELCGLPGLWRANNFIPVVPPRSRMAPDPQGDFPITSCKSEQRLLSPSPGPACCSGPHGHRLHQRGRPGHDEAVLL